MMRELMTISDVEKALQLKKGQIYRLTSQKKIPHYKIGRALRFDPTEIEGWLKGQVRGVEDDEMC